MAVLASSSPELRWRPNGRGSGVRVLTAHAYFLDSVRGTRVAPRCAREGHLHVYVEAGPFVVAAARKDTDVGGSVAAGLGVVF